MIFNEIIVKKIKLVYFNQIKKYIIFIDLR